MEIRALQPEELEHASRLWVAVGLVSQTREALDEATAYHRSDSELVIGAIDGGQLAAAGVGAFDGYRGVLHRIAVAPQWQRQGLGTRIAHELEQRLRVRGARKVRLHVSDTDVPAQTFWQHLGYRHIPVHYLRKP